MFISLNVEPETREAAVTALDALRAELEAKGAPVKEGSWGYRLLIVDDPDGNQLFFNYPSETASGKVLWMKRECGNAVEAANLFRDNNRTTQARNQRTGRSTSRPRDMVYSPITLVYLILRASLSRV